MKRIILGMLLLVPLVASAQSVLLGSRLISKGDKLKRVREAGGEPDRVDRAPEDRMEIWNYKRGNRRVTVWFVDDKVVRAEGIQPSDDTLPARSR